jgi:CRP-like cAMP-binding protein
MSDASHAAKSLRDRLGGHTEDRLGRALSDLLDNPLLTGAIGRAFDAREKATQAQEVAMGALNLPSATDIERLTRRLRSLSQRLEGIEDGVGRLDRALAPSGVDRSDIDRRLSAIESQLDALLLRLDDAPAVRPAAARRKPTARTKPPAARTKPAARRKPPAARSRKGA